MDVAKLPAVSFVAPSGTGKTTLVEQLIVGLKERGYRVGAIKHDAHRFEIDVPGKDSYRFTAAGADVMVLTSDEKLAVVKAQAVSPPVEQLLGEFCADLDVVLVEGFRTSSLPRIEVCRGGRDRMICRGEHHDPNLVAVVSDERFELDVPVLDLDRPAAVVEFVIDRFLA